MVLRARQSKTAPGVEEPGGAFLQQLEEVVGAIYQEDNHTRILPPYLSKVNPNPKRTRPQVKNQGHQPINAVSKITHYTHVMNSKESLYLIAMRWSKVKIFFNCVKPVHQVNEHSNKIHCQVANSKRRHHSLLHYERAAH